MEIEVLLDLIELILTQKDGVDAFAGAVSRGKFCLPYFNYLVEEGILLNGEVLLSATKMRQVELARFVLEKGVRPTLESFQYATEHEFFELCSLFVEFGSREILSTPNLENQVKIACRHNRLEIAKYLINRGVNPTSDINIQAASEHGHTEIVRLLLKHGANPTVNNNLAILSASKNDHIDVVRLLLQNDSKYTVVTTALNRAIKLATAMGHLEVVRALLEYGADPTDEDNYAIKHASVNGYLEIVRLLLQKGAKPIDYAIIYASGLDRIKIIELLEEYKAKY